VTGRPIRFFASDADVRLVGERLLDCTLPRGDWIHEAHLAACVWMLTERPDIDPEADLPGIIRRYNVCAGGENSDHAGYHETLTQLYIRSIRGFLKRCEEGALVARVNALLASEIAPRDWPLSLYSRRRLFSVEARRGWVDPDI